MKTKPRKIHAIFLRPEAGKAAKRVKRVAAKAARGLEGDYLNNKDCELPKDDLKRGVTLIERETLDDVRERHGLELAPGGSRRNIVTENISLNELVGKEIRIGEVRLLGTGLCHPCVPLEEFNKLPGLTAALKGRSGLCTEVLSGGEIKEGDTIVVVE